MNKLSFQLLRYEIFNASSNIFTLIFGVAFPIFMSALFSYIFSSEVPAEVIGEVNAGIFMTMLMVVPLATMFIGYAANYSQEIESGSLQRFKLFGYKESTILIAKLIANLIFLTAALVIYFSVMFLMLKIALPTFSALIILILFIYILAAIFLVLSHAIASLFKRFATTYGVTMTLYFAFMTFGGMMGIKANQFPVVLQFVCKAIPLYYINVDYIQFWLGNSFNFLPLIISTAGAAILSLGLLFLSVLLDKKGNKNRKRENRGITYE